MVGFISLTQRIDEREKYERQELPWGAKWETKGANILVECVPLTWNEWEHPTDEMRREMNLLPTFEMREELSGYRIQFSDTHKFKVRRRTPHPCCIITGKCATDMIFDALLRSIRYLEKYPTWVPDATFIRDSFILHGRYVGSRRDNAFNDPLMLYMRELTGLNTNGRVTPKNLRHDSYVARTAASRI